MRAQHGYYELGSGRSGLGAGLQRARLAELGRVQPQPGARGHKRVQFRDRTRSASGSSPAPLVSSQVPGRSSQTRITPFKRVNPLVCGRGCGLAACGRRPTSPVAGVSLVRVRALEAGGASPAVWAGAGPGLSPVPCEFCEGARRQLSWSDDQA